MQVLVKLFQAQLLAAHGRLPEATRALAECTAQLAGLPEQAADTGGHLRLEHLRLHCAVLQLLVQLASGDTARSLAQQPGAWPAPAYGRSGGLCLHLPILRSRGCG